MVAPIISISSEESVSSHALRVILFGVIHAIIHVIPEVPIVPADPIVAPEEGTVSVVLPTGVLDLVDYSSSSDSDPSEDSLPSTPDLPLVSPFLCSDDSEADDSSSSSSPSSHSLFGHTPPDTIDADSSTPQIFVHRSLTRTPQRTPTPANLLPPRKRFRYSYSSEDSVEDHIEVDTANAEAVADIGINEGVVAHAEDGVGMGFEIATSDILEDEEEFEAEASATDTREIAIYPLTIGDSYESSRGGIPDIKDTIYDIVHCMSEVRIDRITEIETTQRQLEASQLVASRERASLVGRLEEEFRQVCRDRDETRRRLRRLESYVMRHLGFRP
ncbi:hypothetical protein Tco_0548422 [Tanacetum coccineum]